MQLPTRITLTTAHIAALQEAQASLPYGGGLAFHAGQWRAPCPGGKDHAPGIVRELLWLRLLAIRHDATRAHPRGTARITLKGLDLILPPAPAVAA